MCKANHHNLKNCLQILDGVLMNLFTNELKENPKDESMSKSTYMTVLTIGILEKLGNKFPTQKEIDFVESCLKRYGNRKSIKVMFNAACLAA